MITRGTVLSDVVLACKPLVIRFLDDFNDDNRLAQTEACPNHPAWILGHLALYMHRAANAVLNQDDAPLPESDFISGDGTAGNHTRFDTESVAFNSEPGANPDHFPTMARAREIYEAACDRLAETTRAATDEQLQREIAWGPATSTVGDLVGRMMFHNGTHTGQLLDLRRQLGIKRLFS